MTNFIDSASNELPKITNIGIDWYEALRPKPNEGWDVGEYRIRKEETYPLFESINYLNKPLQPNHPSIFENSIPSDVLEYAGIEGVDNYLKTYLWEIIDAFENFELVEVSLDEDPEYYDKWISVEILVDGDSNRIHQDSTSLTDKIISIIPSSKLNKIRLLIYSE